MSDLTDEERLLEEEQRRHPMPFATTHATDRPVYLRRERREGWRGKLPLYVMWCPACEAYTVTHPAGYKARIACRKCRQYHQVMTWPRFRDEVAPVILAFIVLFLAALYFARLRGMI